MLSPITPLAFASATYDVLIVGGGTAGLTVAARLTENPSITVGVIEAGTAQFDNPLVNIPGFSGAPFGTALDWNFTSVPQVELNGNLISYPRGKMLGGSSGINGMLWNRAEAADYDAWEQLGNPSWNWDSMLSYMMKTEKFFPPTLPSQLALLTDPPYIPEFHNTTGSVRNSFEKWFPPVLKAMVPTLEALGIPQNPDSLSGSNLDSYINIASIDPTNSTRSYSATAYLRPNLGRENLVVLPGAQATKIILDDSKKATGVEFVVNDTTYTASAEKEIILSAGSFQSPQLLELSGIGNCSILNSFDIPCLVDNPAVGENLQDHPAVRLVYEFLEGVFTSDLIKSSETLMEEAMEEYNTNHTGFYSGEESVTVMVSLRDFLSDDEVDTIVNLAKSSNSTSPLVPLLTEQLSNGSIPLLELTPAPHLMGAFPEANPNRTYLTMIAGLMHTFSTGSVHINTSNPLAKPIVDPMFYTDPTGVDRAVMIEAVKILDKIASTAPLKNYIDTRVTPPPSEQLTDDEWWEYIQNNSADEWHPVGTCSMLPKEAGGVVDASLQVYGVQGLRVVDASIIPKEIATHIQQSVYGVAEKGADIIKEAFAMS